jgi:peptide-methionine (S)-S-oxide reductase
MDESSRYEKATFAAGCFWDIEAAFRRVNGIIETVAGYTGGTNPDPTYEQVERGSTGYVHAVGLVFDPAVVTYEQLLDLFWGMHDPTQSGGQGDYTGPQYRSVIFFHNNEQEGAACASREQLAASKTFRNRLILTEIRPATRFWPAGECHQHFYEKCGQGYGVSRKIWE